MRICCSVFGTDRYSSCNIRNISFTEFHICCVDSLTVGDIVSTNTFSGGSWIEVVSVYFSVIVFGSPLTSVNRLRLNVGNDSDEFRIGMVPVWYYEFFTMMFIAAL